MTAAELLAELVRVDAVRIEAPGLMDTGCGCCCDRIDPAKLSPELVELLAQVTP